MGSTPVASDFGIIRSAIGAWGLCRNSRKREPTHVSANNCSSISAALPFRVNAPSASAASASEAKSTDSGARCAGKGGLLNDGGVVVRGGRGEDTANRDGIVADGRESAATDG